MSGDTTIEWNMDEPWTHDTPIHPEDVTKNTVMVCPKCHGKSYIKNNKCVRCDLGLV